MKNKIISFETIVTFTIITFVVWFLVLAAYVTDFIIAYAG